MLGPWDRDNSLPFQPLDVAHEAIDIFYFVVFEGRQFTPGLTLFPARFGLGSDHRQHAKLFCLA
jgi:hypothetical protein